MRIKETITKDKLCGWFYNLIDLGRGGGGILAAAALTPLLHFRFQKTGKRKPVYPTIRSKTH